MVTCIKCMKRSFLAQFQHYLNCASMKIVMWIKEIGGLATCKGILLMSIVDRASYSAGTWVAGGCPPVAADHGLWMRTAKAPMVSSFRVSWQSLGESRGTRCGRRGLPGSEQSRLCINIRKYFIAAPCRRTCWDQATVNKESLIFEKCHYSIWKHKWDLKFTVRVEEDLFQMKPKAIFIVRRRRIYRSSCCPSVSQFVRNTFASNAFAGLVFCIIFLNETKRNILAWF